MTIPINTRKGMYIRADQTRRTGPSPPSGPGDSPVTQESSEERRRQRYARRRLRLLRGADAPRVCVRASGGAQGSQPSRRPGGGRSGQDVMIRLECGAGRAESGTIGDGREWRRVLSPAPVFMCETKDPKSGPW